MIIVYKIDENGNLLIFTIENVSRQKWYGICICWCCYVKTSQDPYVWEKNEKQKILMASYYRQSF